MQVLLLLRVRGPSPVTTSHAGLVGNASLTPHPWFLRCCTSRSMPPPVPGGVQHGVEEPDCARHGAVPPCRPTRKLPRHGRDVRVNTCRSRRSSPASPARRLPGEVARHSRVRLPWYQGAPEDMAAAAARGDGAVVCRAPSRLGKLLLLPLSLVAWTGRNWVPPTEVTTHGHEARKTEAKWPSPGRAVAGVVAVDAVGQLVSGAAVGGACQHRHAVQAQLEEFEALAPGVCVPQSVALYPPGSGFGYTRGRTAGPGRCGSSGR